MKMRLGMALTAALAAVTGFTRPASAAHCGCTGEPAATSAGLFNGQIAAGFANLFGGLGSGSSNGCTATETQYKDVTVTEMRPMRVGSFSATSLPLPLADRVPADSADIATTAIAIANQ